MAKHVESAPAATRDGCARRERVDGEEGACDRGERRGEPVHVVEQVERVRHPDQPEPPTIVASTGLEMIWTCSPVVSTSAAAPTWALIFVSGFRVSRSSTSPAVNRIAQPPRIPRARASTCDPSRGRGDAAADERAGEDAAAAEQRRRAHVPAVGARRRDDVARGRCRAGAPRS